MSDSEKRGGSNTQDDAPGGKLIHEEVFLSRLAARQEVETDPEDRAEALTVLAEALESLGITPDHFGQDFPDRVQASAALPPVGDPALEATLEDMAVEELFQEELHTGRRPQIRDYLERYPRQRDALLRMVSRMDPRELVGDLPPDALTPEAHTMLGEGVREGEERALRLIVANLDAPRRRKSRMVAEERAPYHIHDESPEAPRARPAQSDESEPEG
ncbi:MAG TPA: hypothetical protein VF808_09865 [Ktedonobacterales bacterium]